MKNIHLSSVNFSASETLQASAASDRPPLRTALARLDHWVLAAISVGIVLRLARLGDAPLWFDETFTATWTRLPWLEMIRIVFADNHLPLYFVLLKGWTLNAGASPWSLRLPSAVFSWMMVPLLAAIGWTIKGRSTARWAAWFAALSPYLLQHGQEARMYPLLGALAAVNTLIVVRFLSEKSRRLGLTFLFMNMAMLSTHYYSVFFIGAELLALLSLARMRWRSWAPTMAVSAVLVAGPMFAAKYLATPHAGGSYEMGLFAFPGVVWSLLSGYTLLPSSEALHEQGMHAALAYLPIALFAFVALLFVGVAALRTLQKVYSFFLIGTIGIVTLGPFLIGVFFDIGINPRYAMACCPAFLALLAAGAAESKEDRPRAIASVALLAIMAVASALHLSNPGHGREDILAAGQWLNANVSPDQEILVTSGEMATLAQFHWPNRRFRPFPAEKVVANRGNASQLAVELPFFDADRVIYIFGRTWLSDPDGALRAALKARYRECPGMKTRGIEVLCLERRRYTTQPLRPILPYL